MFTLIVRLVVSLAIVLGLLLIIAGTLKKRGIAVGGGGLGKGSRSSAQFDLEILTRKPLGRSAQLAVVRTADKTLVLGITEHQITMLTEIDSTLDLDDARSMALDISSPIPTEAQRTALLGTNPGSFPTWKTLIDNVRDKTVRHH